MSYEAGYAHGSADELPHKKEEQQWEINDNFKMYEDGNAAVNNQEDNMDVENSEIVYNQSQLLFPPTIYSEVYKIPSISVDCFSFESFKSHLPSSVAGNFSVSSSESEMSGQDHKPVKGETEQMCKPDQHKPATALRAAQNDNTPEELKGLVDKWNTTLSVNSGVCNMASVSRGPFNIPLWTGIAPQPPVIFGSKQENTCGSAEMNGKILPPLRDLMVSAFTSQTPSNPPLADGGHRHRCDQANQKCCETERDMVLGNDNQYMPQSNTAPALDSITQELDQWDVSWEAKVAQINDWLFESIESKGNKKVDSGHKVVKDTQLNNKCSSMEE